MADIRQDNQLCMGNRASHIAIMRELDRFVVLTVGDRRRGPDTAQLLVREMRLRRPHLTYLFDESGVLIWSFRQLRVFQATSFDETAEN